MISKWVVVTASASSGLADGTGLYRARHLRFDTVCAAAKCTVRFWLIPRQHCR